MTNKTGDFYCHSRRLYIFLSLFGFDYVSKLDKFNKPYWVFKQPKDDSLKVALEKWNELKELFPLEKVIKKSMGQ